MVPLSLSKCNVKLGRGQVILFLQLSPCVLLGWREGDSCAWWRAVITVPGLSQPRRTCWDPPAQPGGPASSHSPQSPLGHLRGGHPCAGPAIILIIGVILTTQPHSLEKGIPLSTVSLEAVAPGPLPASFGPDAPYLDGETSDLEEREGSEWVGGFQTLFPQL